jgi:pyridoxal biosynthesis lyase PdxS
MNNAASALMKLKSGKRKRVEPRTGNVVNAIMSMRITNRMKYINTSPHMTREEKNFIREKVKNENATLEQIKLFEKVMKARAMNASSKFLKKFFTPRKNVTKK